MLLKRCGDEWRDWFTCPQAAESASRNEPLPISVGDHVQTGPQQLQATNQQAPLHQGEYTEAPDCPLPTLQYMLKYHLITVWLVTAGHWTEEEWKLLLPGWLNQPPVHLTNQLTDRPIDRSLFKTINKVSKSPTNMSSLKQVNIQSGQVPVLTPHQFLSASVFSGTLVSDAVTGAKKDSTPRGNYGVWLKGTFTCNLWQ